MKANRQSLDFSQNIFCPRYSHEQDAKIVQMCLDEPRLFMESYCYINSKEQGLVKFKMRSDQEIVYNLFQGLRHRNRRVRFLVLKARQVGVSSLIQLLIFTLCRLRRYTDALLIAHKDSTSKKVGEMFRIAYDNLPHEIRPGKETRTDEKLKFAGINSSIVTTTAKTEDPARGLSLHCLHSTEAAFWPTFMHTLVPILNCLAKDARSSFAGVETTANSMEDDFAELWDSVTKGHSSDNMADDDLEDWTPVFLPWWIHPFYEAGKLDLADLNEHDMKTLSWEKLSDAERELVEMDKQEWTKAFPYIRSVLRDMPFEQWQKKIKWRRWCLHNECNDSEIKFLREFGESPETAFMAQGQTILDKRAIIWYKRHTEKQGIVGRMEKDANGAPIFVSRDEHVMQCAMEGRKPDPDVLFPLTVWEFPRREERYGAGVDCAMGSADALERERGDLAMEGDTDSDFSTMEVFSEHRVQCAELRSRVLPPYDFAEMVALVGMFWNQTKIMVEAGYAGGNTAGFAVLQRLKDIYRNLARWERVDHAGKKLTEYVGWTPNPAAQEAFMGELQRALNHGAGMLTPGTEGDFDIHYPRLKIHSVALLNELLHYKLMKSGRVGAAHGSHDDLVRSAGLALLTLKQMGRPRSLTTPDLHNLPNEAVSYDAYGHRDWNSQGDDGFPSWLFA